MSLRAIGFSSRKQSARSASSDKKARPPPAPAEFAWEEEEEEEQQVEEEEEEETEPPLSATTQPKSRKRSSPPNKAEGSNSRRSSTTKKVDFASSGGDDDDLRGSKKGGHTSGEGEGDAADEEEGMLKPADSLMTSQGDDDTVTTVPTITAPSTAGPGLTTPLPQLLPDSTMDESPPPQLCRDLEPYPLSRIDQNVYIATKPGKGRCLFARREFKSGDVIFVESPVLVATPELDKELWSMLNDINSQETLQLPPIWHLAAICSLTKLDISGQRIVGDKFVPDPNAPPSRDALRVLAETGLALDPARYERSLNAWRVNGFGHHTHNEGLILCNRISNMAHSCNASVTWHFGQGDCFVIRSRQHLYPGDEMTISYIGDEDIIKSTHLRRERLQGWHFVCKCERCEDQIDRARGFRCPDCGVGSVYLRSVANEDEEFTTTAAPCSVCKLQFSQEQIQQYEVFEEAYASRLQETTKDCLSDAELVYTEAMRVFNQHWLLYELDTILFEGYKDRSRWVDAAFHQQKRIAYSLAVNPKLSFTTAGMYEDLGDLLANAALVERGSLDKITGFQRNAISRAYEDAFNSLIVLCGADHDYTIAAHTKFDQILRAEVEDADELPTETTSGAGIAVSEETGLGA